MRWTASVCVFAGSPRGAFIMCGSYVDRVTCCRGFPNESHRKPDLQRQCQEDGFNLIPGVLCKRNASK